METEVKSPAHQLASDVFDKFVEVCTKYKIDFGTFKVVSLPKDVVQPGSPELILEHTPAAAPKPVVVKIRKPAVRKRKVAPDTVEEFIKWFCTAAVKELYKVTRSGWTCAKSEEGIWTLTFKSKLSGTRYDSSSHILGLRLPSKPELVMINGGNLKYGGSHSGGASLPQTMAMDTGALPIPLRIITNTVKDGGLAAKIQDIAVVDWTGQEKITAMMTSQFRRGWSDQRVMFERHFAGAVLLTIGKDYYLLDVDREELKYANFNAFFTKLSGKAETVEEAYEILKPNEVKNGPYVRQGELFFVKVEDDVMRKIVVGDKGTAAKEVYENIMKVANRTAVHEYNSRIRSLRSTVSAGKAKDEFCKSHPEIIDDLLKKFTEIPVIKKDQDLVNSDRLDAAINNPFGIGSDIGLKASQNITLGRTGQDNRSWQDRHRVTMLYQHGEELYVYGAVIHTQHHPIYLPGWHRVWKNTAAGAWNITGEID